ncbi:MAG TPA: hypothetical protein VF011_06550 [Terriglobales bacterium]
MPRAVYPGGGDLRRGAVSVGVSRLKPAAPAIERATVRTGTVKRGPMLRQMRGSRQIPAENGQQYKWESEHNGTKEQLRTIRDNALNAVRQSLKLEPKWAASCAMATELA